MASVSRVAGASQRTLERLFLEETARGRRTLVFGLDCRSMATTRRESDQRPLVGSDAGPS